VAARLRRELGVEVDTVKGKYGEYKVLVDGKIVVNAGAMVALGVFPPAKKTVEKVRARLSG